MDNLYVFLTVIIVFPNLLLKLPKIISNISKTSASVSSGFPNTRKLMKARGHRPSAFIVFELFVMRYGVVTFSASQRRAEEEVNLVQNGVPKSTHYKNQWGYGIFE